MTESSQPHILVFESGVEGHHLRWLRYVTDDLLTAGFRALGFRVTVVVDWRLKAKELIQNNFLTLTVKISIISIFNKAGKLREGGAI